MQSGKGRTKAWVLEHEPAASRQIDPLMGWTSASDMGQQVRLSFATKEEAIAYAERNGLAYTVTEACHAQDDEKILRRQLQVWPDRLLDPLTLAVPRRWENERSSLRKPSNAPINMRHGPVAQLDRAGDF